jgi:hypothetical protein
MRVKLAPVPGYQPLERRRVTPAGSNEQLRLRQIIHNPVDNPTSQATTSPAPEQHDGSCQPQTNTHDGVTYVEVLGPAADDTALSSYLESREVTLLTLRKKPQPDLD